MAETLARIARPTSTDTRYIILGRGRMVKLHFDKQAGGNVPCQDKPCLWCARPLPVYRRWYLPAVGLDATSGRFVVPYCLELPQDKGEALAANDELRGQIVRVGVHGSRPKRTELVCVGPIDKADLDRLTPSFDVTPHIERVFGFAISTRLQQDLYGDPIIKFRRA